MLTNFFHNTELSLYQLSSLFQYQKTSHCWRGLLLYLNPSILSLFRSSYLPAKHHQRCKVWHRHQPIENIRYRPDGFHPADAAEKDRNKITPVIQNTYFVGTLLWNIPHQPSKCLIADVKPGKDRGKGKQHHARRRHYAACISKTAARAAATAPLPPREPIFPVRLCGNTQSSKKRSGCTL